jgi:Leucine-rich repeat (LRR) protein
LADNITSETYWYKIDGTEALHSVNDNSKSVEAKHLICKKSSEVLKKINFLNNFPKLEKIDARACKISEIDYDLHNVAGLSFFLHKLHTLDLSYNKITYIGQHCFYSLQFGLKTLNLSSNAITSLELEAFYHLKDLKILDLSNNRIAYIYLSSFKDLEKLKEFYFANNQFQTLDFGLFSESPHLQTMNFSFNEIYAITFPALIWRSLTTLDLSNNKIYQIGTYIKSQRFPNLKNLILSEASKKPDSSSTSSNQHNETTQESKRPKTEVIDRKIEFTTIFLISYVTIITILILFIAIQLYCTTKRINIANHNAEQVDINPVYANMDGISTFLIICL